MSIKYNELDCTEHLPAARLFFLQMMSAVMMRTATHSNTSTLITTDRLKDPGSHSATSEYGGGKITVR